MADKDQILAEALKMPPAERVDIVDRLLQSLDKPDAKINRQRKREAESRIDGFEAGNINTISVEEVLDKYKDS